VVSIDKQNSVSQNFALNIPMGVCKDRGKKSGELKLTELVKRAQRVLNTSRKLAEERCQLEARLKSSQPTEGDDSWRND